MGLLAGFKYSVVVKKLRKAGFEFDRMAKGSHEIWWSPETRARTTIPNHPGDIPQGTMRSILKQARIDPKAFLKL